MTPISPLLFILNRLQQGHSFFLSPCDKVVIWVFDSCKFFEELRLVTNCRLAARDVEFKFHFGGILLGRLSRLREVGIGTLEMFHLFEVFKGDERHCDWQKLGTELH